MFYRNNFLIKYIKYFFNDNFLLAIFLFIKTTTDDEAALSSTKMVVSFFVVVKISFDILCYMQMSSTAASSMVFNSETYYFRCYVPPWQTWIWNLSSELRRCMMHCGCRWTIQWTRGLHLGNCGQGFPHILLRHMGVLYCTSSNFAFKMISLLILLHVVKVKLFQFQANE